MAARRIAALQGITILDVSSAVADLARGLVAGHAVPAKAAIDAIALNGMDFLLTWNCAHIANATTRVTIERVCRAAGVAPPVICTPEELTEE